MSTLKIEPSAKNIKDLINQGKIVLNGNHEIIPSRSYAFKKGKLKMLSTGGYAQKWLTIGEIK